MYTYDGNSGTTISVRVNPGDRHLRQGKSGRCGGSVISGRVNPGDAHLRQGKSGRCGGSSVDEVERSCLLFPLGGEHGGYGHSNPQPGHQSWNMACVRMAHTDAANLYSRITSDPFWLKP